MDSKLSLQKLLQECYTVDPMELLLPLRPPLKLRIQEQQSPGCDPGMKILPSLVGNS